MWKGLEGLLRGFVQKYEQDMAASQLYTDAPEDLTCYRTYSGELIHYGVILLLNGLACLLLTLLA